MPTPELAHLINQLWSTIAFPGSQRPLHVTWPHWATWIFPLLQQGKTGWVCIRSWKYVQWLLQQMDRDSEQSASTDTLVKWHSQDRKWNFSKKIISYSINKTHWALSCLPHGPFDAVLSTCAWKIHHDVHFHQWLLKLSQNGGKYVALNLCLWGNFL